MVRPSRLLTVATTNWRPVCVSSAASLLERSSSCSGLSRSAWSTTRPVSGGKVWAAAGSANSASQTAAMIRSILALVAEVDLGRFLGARRRLERHLGLGAIEDLGADRVREGPDAGVIGLDRLIIIPAGDQDRILRALDLALQGQEVLVRLEVRITLEGDE